MTSQKARRKDAEPADDELIGWDSTQLPGALLSKIKEVGNWWCEADPALLQPADDGKSGKQMGRASRFDNALLCCELRDAASWNDPKEGYISMHLKNKVS